MDWGQRFTKEFSKRCSRRFERNGSRVLQPVRRDVGIGRAILTLNLVDAGSDFSGVVESAGQV
jgi:hypothetical protein